MNKSSLTLILFLFATNDDQANFARSNAVQILKEENLLVEINGGADLQLTDTAIAQLKETFGIKFEGEK